MLDQSQRSKTVSAKIIFRSPEQPSFSINEQITGLTPQNFEGRVFNTTQCSNFTTTQKEISNCFIKEAPRPPPTQIYQVIQQSQPIQLMEHQQQPRPAQFFERRQEQ